jgi:predicted nucleic acid-binding protein
LIFYVDTSVMVAALTRESGSARVDAWLNQQKPAELAISEWVVTEVSSALSIKVRMGHISAEERAAAAALFAQISARSFGLLRVSSTHFRVAARYADQHALGLRAADALHLAICADHGATLCTQDKKLGRAAAELGLGIRLL